MFIMFTSILTNTRTLSTIKLTTLNQSCWNDWSQLVLPSIREFSKSELKFLRRILRHIVNQHGVQALVDNLELCCLVEKNRIVFEAVGLCLFLGSSGEVSAIRIAYLIGRRNGRSNSSFRINSCCNNGESGSIFINKFRIFVWVL